MEDLLTISRHAAWYNTIPHAFFTWNVWDIFCDIYNTRLVSGTRQPSGTPPKRHLNLLEIHEIGPLDTSESKQRNYYQIWHMYRLYQQLLGLSHVSWLSPSPVVDCNRVAYHVLVQSAHHTHCTSFNTNFCTGVSFNITISSLCFLPTVMGSASFYELQTAHIAENYLMSHLYPLHICFVIFKGDCWNILLCNIT